MTNFGSGCKSVGSAFEGSNPPLPNRAVYVTYTAFFYFWQKSNTYDKRGSGGFETEHSSPHAKALALISTALRGIRLPVRPQYLRAVPVHVNRVPGRIQVTVNKKAYDPLKPAIKIRLLGNKKGGLPCPPSLTKGRRGIFGVKVAGYGKNNRYQIVFGEVISCQ